MNVNRVFDEAINLFSEKDQKKIFHNRIYLNLPSSQISIPALSLRMQSKKLARSFVMCVQQAKIFDMINIESHLAKEK